MMQIRVLIIAGDPLARAGLAALLAGQTQLQIAGQVAPEDDPPAQVETYRPDVILWDVGWDAAAPVKLLAELSDVGTPVVALVPEQEAAAGLWSTGVGGLLLRDAGLEALCAALLAAAQGLVVLAPNLAGVLRVPPAPAASLAEALTPRELDVLRRLAEGLSNKQIARQLAISEHTIKFHVNAIMGKLGAQSRTEAVVRATRAGLIFL